MTTMQVEVESEIVGGNPQLPRLGSVIVKLAATTLTAGDLIRRTVEEQVWSLLSDRKLREQEARQVLDRQYLTDDEIRVQATSGAVRIAGKGRRDRKIDVEVEVNRAVRAFQSGLFAILVDGQQLMSLEDQVTLQQASKVTFLRLTPLAGG